MERLRLPSLEVSISWTGVPYSIAADRLLTRGSVSLPSAWPSEAEVVGPVKSASGSDTAGRRHRGQMHVCLSTFHAEEEVQGRLEDAQALKLRGRGPVLIACPTSAAFRSTWTPWSPTWSADSGPTRTIKIAVLGCTVNGSARPRTPTTGHRHEERRADLLGGQPLRKVPQEQLVEELFLGSTVRARPRERRRRWPRRPRRRVAEQIKEANVNELTPSGSPARGRGALVDADAIDEALSPVAGTSSHARSQHRVVRGGPALRGAQPAGARAQRPFDRLPSGARRRTRDARRRAGR